METRYQYALPDDPLQAQSAVEEAADIIRTGGLVIFPTETVYGLGANALFEDAAAKIYAAKGRPADNPLIVHVAHPKDAEGFAHTTPLYYRLAEAFMPGPLTVILAAKDNLPRTVTAGLDTVAVRCPSHPVAAALIEASGVPIAAPSANLSGSPSPTNALHAKDDMWGRVDMILDGGECLCGVESTIVKPEEDGSLLLLRPGSVTKEALETRLGVTVRVAPAVLGQLKEGEKVLSPGMKYRHYAPKAQFILLDGTAESRIKFLAEQKSNKIAYLCYDEEGEVLSALPVKLLFIGKEQDTQAQAQVLFRILRDTDKEGFDVIYTPLPKTEGLGLALYNRMIRAAAHQIISL